MLFEFVPETLGSEHHALDLGEVQDGHFAFSTQGFDHGDGRLPAPGVVIRRDMRDDLGPCSDRCDVGSKDGNPCRVGFLNRCPDGSAIARGQNDRSYLLDDEVLDLVLLLVRVVLATDANKFVAGLEGLLLDGLGDLDKEWVCIRQDRDTDKLRRSFARRFRRYFIRYVFT